MPEGAPDPSALVALRPVLLGHCYRMLGSPIDAEDAVQETLVRAFRALPDFEERASLKTWALRIATHVCLDEIARGKRRLRPTAHPPGTPEGPFDPTAVDDWIEPIPDAWVTEGLRAPEAIVAARQSVRLAFVAALQYLPPRQRAVLLLTEVVGLSAREVALALDTTPSAVNSALQRARATLAAAPPEARAPAHAPEIAQTAERYAAAFSAYDLDALVGMLTDDVTFDMPPIPLWLRGPRDVAAFLRGPGAECQGSVVVPVRANGAFGLAQYRHGGRTPWGIVVLATDGDRVTQITTFLGGQRLFPMFGLPMQWRDGTPTDEFRGAWQSIR